MKFTAGIIMGIILGVLIIIGVAVYVFFAYFNNNQGLTTASTPTPSKTIITSPSNTHNTTSPTLKPSPSPSANSATNSPTPTSGTANNVNFDLGVTNYSINGVTSGTVDAFITNTGTADAHNAWIKVEVTSKGSTINIDGQPYYRKDIGTIKAGTTINEQVTLSVSALDGLKVLTNGATIKLTIYSDEKTQELNYDLAPQL